MKLTESDIAYLRQAASRDNYNPNDAIKIFSYESSNRPDVWGGKGNQYFGIFQAGPSERAQFGIDTKNPSAKNQIDAFGKFLHARGFKPGMGLMDMYSTVLAGSPGHYNRSDGAGTVAQHVGKMNGSAPPAFPAVSGSVSYAPSEPAAPTSINDLLPTPAKPVAAGMLGLRQAEPVAAPTYNDEMRQQMNEFHRQMHERSVAGLLGRN